MATALLLDYRGRDSDEYISTVLAPIIARLNGLSQVQILIHPQNVSLVERRQEEDRWQSSINTWSTHAARGFATATFYDVYGTPAGPCEDWFKNMWLAFQDSDIQRIVYLPFDIAYMVPPASPQTTDGRLQSFIDRANKDEIDLLLGTYESSTQVAEATGKNFLVETRMARTGSRRDIPKNLLEDFTMLELWRAFPESTGWFCEKRNDPQHKPKPRTGFFSVSRRLYQEFVDRPRRPTMMPWAGTVQLLICAVVRTREGKRSFRVAEEFVSDLREPAASFAQYGVAHQRERIAYVISDERHYWSRLLPQLPL